MLMWKKLAFGVVGFSALQGLNLIKPFKIISDNLPETEFERISFKTQDGIEIAGWWVPSDSNATIIIGHGYPFDKGNIYGATKWLSPSYNLLYYDHRSFGESKGKITTGGVKEVKDVEAAIKFAQTKAEGPIGLLGFSLSAAAMLMADHSQVKALVADSTYASLENIINHLYSVFGPLRLPFVTATRILSYFLLGSNRPSPVEAIAKTSIPILLIHGKEDTQIPIENAHQLFQAANKETTELILFDNGDHGQSLVKPSIRKSILKFFRKSLL